MSRIFQLALLSLAVVVWQPLAAAFGDPAHPLATLKHQHPRLIINDADIALVE